LDSAILADVVLVSDGSTRCWVRTRGRCSRWVRS